MKRNLLAGLFLLLALGVCAQKRVVEPVRTDYAYVATFDRIEVTKERTIADVTLRYAPKEWIWYTAATTYLRDCNSGREYKLLGAEGFELDKRVYMPESGEMKVRFFFEPLDADVQRVDFIDAGWDRFDHTFGISLAPSDGVVPPDWALGNWLTTDGSNEWVCGFTAGTAIWQKDFWNYGSVVRKGKVWQIGLSNAGRSETLYLKEGKDGALVLSTDGKTFVTLGREPVRCSGMAAGWKYNPEKYRDILYGKQKVVVRGLLDGYSPGMGFTTGALGTDDEILRREIYNLIEIRPDGRFEVEVEVENPQSLDMQIGEGIWADLFVEPGDTLMCYYNIADLGNTRFRESGQKWSRARFMGRAAQVNQAYRMAEPMMPNARNVYDRSQECIAKGATDEFVGWIDSRLRQVDDSLAAFFDRYRLSDRTRDWLYTNFRQAEYVRLLDYGMSHSSKKYNYSQDKDGRYTATLNPDYKPLPESFYDFVTMELADNPLMITTKDFSTMINRLEYGHAMDLGKAFNAFNRNAKRSDVLEYARKKVLDSIPEPVGRQRATLDYVYADKHDSTVVAPVLDTAVIGSFTKYMIEAYHRHYEQNDSLRGRFLYRDAFDSLCGHGLDRCLAYDYTLARNYRHEYERATNDSVRLDILTKLLPYVKTPYVVGKIVQLYASGLGDGRRQDADKPRTAADDYFDELIAPYKGNVLFIDFWATSCGPCRAGMIAAKETVEELKDRKVKFLYVTDESQSPMAVYEKFLNENQIKGEHIRVSSAQWNLLKVKFGIGGIPHCVVADKAGKVVDNNTWGMIGPQHCKGRLLDLEKEEF